MLAFLSEDPGTAGRISRGDRPSRLLRSPLLLLWSFRRSSAVVSVGVAGRRFQLHSALLDSFRRWAGIAGEEEEDALEEDAEEAEEAEEDEEAEEEEEEEEEEDETSTEEEDNSDDRYTDDDEDVFVPNAPCDDWYYLVSVVSALCLRDVVRKVATEVFLREVSAGPIILYPLYPFIHLFTPYYNPLYMYNTIYTPNTRLNIL